MTCIRCKSCGVTPGKSWDMAWNHEQDLCPDCTSLHKKGSTSERRTSLTEYLACCSHIFSCECSVNTCFIWLWFRLRVVKQVLKNGLNKLQSVWQERLMMWLIFDLYSAQVISALFATSAMMTTTNTRRWFTVQSVATGFITNVKDFQVSNTKHCLFIYEFSKWSSVFIPIRHINSCSDLHLVWCLVRLRLLTISSYSIWKHMIFHNETSTLLFHVKDYNRRAND